MKFPLTILLILMALCSCDTAQNDLMMDSRVFFKYYGGEYIEEGYDVVQSNDLGYVVVGTTTSVSKGENRDILIVKTDERGNTQWIKTIGGDGDDVARKVKLLADGGYMIIGDYTIIENEIENKEIILIRLDPLGNEIWRKTYGHTNGVDHFADEGMDVAINHDGNYLVVGQTHLSNDDTEIMFFVVDGNGNQIGETTLIGQQQTIEFAKTVLPDPTGKNLAFIVGYTNHSESFGQEGYNLFLININKDGSVPFPNIIGGLNDEFGEMMILTDDNKLIVLGSEIRGATSRIFLRKINLDLDTEWVEYIDVEGMEYLKGAGICKTKDGFVIIAERRITGINSDMVLLKVDLNGTMEWKTTVRSFGGEYNDTGNAIIVDRSENLLITGRSSFTALGSNAKMCLIKIRYDGELKP